MSTFWRPRAGRSGFLECIVCRWAKILRRLAFRNLTSSKTFLSFEWKTWSSALTLSMHLVRVVTWSLTLSLYDVPIGCCSPYLRDISGFLTHAFFNDAKNDTAALEGCDSASVLSPFIKVYSAAIFFSFEPQILCFFHVAYTFSFPWQVDQRALLRAFHSNS